MNGSALTKGRMTRVLLLTQSAASAAEEMSSSAEQLAALAQEMQKMTSQFKLDSGTAATVATHDHGGTEEHDQATAASGSQR